MCNSYTWPGKKHPEGNEHWTCCDNIKNESKYQTIP